MLVRPRRTGRLYVTSIHFPPVGRRSPSLSGALHVTPTCVAAVPDGLGARRAAAGAAGAGGAEVAGAAGGVGLVVVWPIAKLPAAKSAADREIQWRRIMCPPLSSVTSVFRSPKSSGNGRKGR